MDITLRNGRTYYQVQPTLASILCELELAEKFERPAPIPTPATWVVDENQMSGRRWIVVKSDGGRVTNWYDGPPERIETSRKLYRPTLADALEA